MQQRKLGAQRSILDPHPYPRVATHPAGDALMGVGGWEGEGQCEANSGFLSQSPGVEMLCWQEISKSLALMGELPAPCPQFWELGSWGP